MEKAFCLKDSHFPTNNIARQHTLDRRVDWIMFLRKTEWPNRLKEECFACPKCRGWILPKEVKTHKNICKERIKEIENDVGSGTRIA